MITAHKQHDKTRMLSLLADTVSSSITNAVLLALRGYIYPLLCSVWTNQTHTN